jgi:thiol-disulfide isomerase/thioredoxin
MSGMERKGERNEKTKERKEWKGEELQRKLVGASAGILERCGGVWLMRKIGVALVIVAVVGLAFWAGIHDVRVRHAGLKLHKEDEVTLTKADGTGGSGGMQGAELMNKPAPAFTLTDLEGKKVSLADFKGHPVVVNFWATWCGPCKLEMPWFEEMNAKYKDKGLVILGLSQDDGTPKDDIEKAAKKIGVTYRILLPDEKVPKAYGGVDYLPETFYVSAKGDVVRVNSGAPPSKDEIEANIQKTIEAGQ